MGFAAQGGRTTRTSLKGYRWIDRQPTRARALALSGHKKFASTFGAFVLTQQDPKVESLCFFF